MAKIISVVNLKGGVLKTTTVQHLGAALAMKGNKVLLVDMDISQASLTKCVRGALHPEQKGVINACIMGDKDIILKTKIDNMHIIPSEKKLNGIPVSFDLMLAQDQQTQLIRLRRILNSFKKHYDYILIDNGPSLGLSYMNSVVASDYVIIPSLADMLAVEGVLETIDNINGINQNPNINIEILGVLLTMTDGRESILKATRQYLKNNLECDLFDTEIRRNAKFKHLVNTQSTIFDLESEADQAKGKGKGRKNFLEVAQEVIDRISLSEAQKETNKSKEKRNEQSL